LAFPALFQLEDKAQGAATLIDAIKLPRAGNSGGVKMNFAVSNPIEIGSWSKLV
jgi:hypothetical protein